MWLERALYKSMWVWVYVCVILYRAQYKSMWVWVWVYVCG